MTEKLNTQDCIARVYQFLSDYNKSGNWQVDADTNGDDTVIQTEFRGFMLKNIVEWNGENKYDSEDIINKFWKSINTQTTGNANVRGTSNKIALDEKELKEMAKNLAISDAIRTYADAITDFPNFVKNNQDLKNEYLDLIKASLFTAAIGENTIKSFEYSEDKRTEFISTVSAKLGNLYPECAKTATAKLCKQQAVDTVKALGIKGYDADKDKSLEKIINGYLNEIKNKTNITPDQIYNELMTLINEYLQTADQSLPSGSYTPQTGMKTSDGTSDLNIKYILGNTSGINELQNAVLTQGFTDTIVGKITNHKVYGPIYADTTIQAMIDAEISTFVAQKIKDNASKGFEEIKKLYDSAADEFIDTKMKKIKDNIDNEALDTARTNLKNACKYDTKYEPALEAVFGAGNKTKDLVEAEIDKLTDVSVINAKTEDIKARIKAIDDAEAAAAAERAKYGDSFNKLSTVASSISSDSNMINQIKSGRNSIHTEFGLDASGNIIFEQSDTTAVYGALAYVVKNELETKYPEQFELLKDKLDRLIQAAWIMTYSSEYGSSCSHNTEEFIKKTLNNLQSIMRTLDKHPEYLSIYTDHMAYGDSSVTSGVRHYQKNDTWGEDQKINYGDGQPYIKSDGTVHIMDSTDDPDYQATMADLLNNLKKKYASIGNDKLIETVFRKAQMEALLIFQNNTNDCPYGTTWALDVNDYYNISYGHYRNSQYVAIEHTDWSGTSRENDGSCATMQAIVQQTLYCFDRLLYAELASL